MKQKHKPIKQAFTTYDRLKTLSFAVFVMDMWQRIDRSLNLLMWFPSATITNSFFSKTT